LPLPAEKLAAVVFDAEHDAVDNIAHD
jgi:hypothetical protein